MVRVGSGLLITELALCWLQSIWQAVRTGKSLLRREAHLVGSLGFGASALLQHSVPSGHSNSLGLLILIQSDSQRGGVQSYLFISVVFYLPNAVSL